MADMQKYEMGEHKIARHTTSYNLYPRKFSPYLMRLRLVTVHVPKAIRQLSNPRLEMLNSHVPCCRWQSSFHSIQILA